jgi:hypothetical protein
MPGASPPLVNTPILDMIDLPRWKENTYISLPPHEAIDKAFG